MTKKQFESLRRGDIIRHVASIHSYLVDNVHVKNGETTLLLVRTMTATNPIEWELIERK